MIGTQWTRRGIGAAATSAGVLAAGPEAWGGAPQNTVDIGGGVHLAYVEAGRGEPVVFVHGSLSDYSYWDDQIAPFAEARRVIAYSRRYNAPNSNPPRPGYSAVTDSEDLARLIETLGLGRVHVVGHSYGALAALFLAISRPKLVRTLVVAEAPAVSLLAHVQGEHAELGRAMLADINARMVAPMRAAFAEGRREAGVEIFIDYVFGRPGTWRSFSPASKAETLKDAGEWDVMMISGELFPELPPQQVRAIAAPVLLLSGEKSYPFLAVIDQALTQLLPDNRRIVIKNATHQMWLQEPRRCRDSVLAFQAAYPPRDRVR
jgi:non-heme chloroperoxidase